MWNSTIFAYACQATIDYYTRSLSEGLVCQEVSSHNIFIEKYASSI